MGQVFDVSPQVAILLVAARWARVETRVRARRQGTETEAAALTFDRRGTPERRN